MAELMTLRTAVGPDDDDDDLANYIRRNAASRGITYLPCLSGPKMATLYGPRPTPPMMVFKESASYMMVFRPDNPEEDQAQETASYYKQRKTNFGRKWLPEGEAWRVRDKVRDKVCDDDWTEHLWSEVDAFCEKGHYCLGRSDEDRLRDLMPYRHIEKVNDLIKGGPQMLMCGCDKRFVAVRNLEYNVMCSKK